MVCRVLIADHANARRAIAQRNNENTQMEFQSIAFECCAKLKFLEEKKKLKQEILQHRNGCKVLQGNWSRL